MGRPKKVREPLPPIWRHSDEQWVLIEPILETYDPPAPKGPARTDKRAILDALIFRLRTGCQWNRLPGEYPDDSTVHRHLQRCVERGVLDRIWATVQEACEDLGGCDWGAARRALPRPAQARLRPPLVPPLPSRQPHLR